MVGDEEQKNENVVVVFFVEFLSYLDGKFLFRSHTKFLHIHTRTHTLGLTPEKYIHTDKKKTTVCLCVCVCREKETHTTLLRASCLSTENSRRDGR